MNSGRGKKSRSANSNEIRRRVVGAVFASRRVARGRAVTVAKRRREKKGKKERRKTKKERNYASFSAV